MKYSDLLSKYGILNYTNFKKKKYKNGKVYFTTKSEIDIEYIKGCIKHSINLINSFIDENLEIKKIGSYKIIEDNYNFKDGELLLDFKPLTNTGKIKKVPFIIKPVFIKNPANTPIARFDISINKEKKINNCVVRYYIDHNSSRACTYSFYLKNIDNALEVDEAYYRMLCDD